MCTSKDKLVSLEDKAKTYQEIMYRTNESGISYTQKYVTLEEAQQTIFELIIEGSTYNGRLLDKIAKANKILDEEENSFISLTALTKHLREALK